MIRFFRGLRKRLLIENRVSTYLLYSIGEILLVVIGILIALQINNANDTRKERVKEVNYLENIKTDLNINIQEMDRYLAVRTECIEAAQRIIAHFEGKPITDYDDFNADGVSIYGWQKFYQSNNTFQELVNSGNLALISNESIKNKLLDLESLYKKMKSEEDLQEACVAFFGNATYYQCWSAKRDPGEFGVDLAFADISGNALCDRNVIIASNDGTYVAFEAGPDGVGAALLKGGSGGGNVYVYQPQALSDSGLASPLNPSGFPAALSHADGFCWNPVENDPGPGIGCYENETAWANGTRYVKKGNWATYTAYSGQPKTVVLFAGQTMFAGDVTFSAPVAGVVTITVQLDTGWRFALEPVGDDSGTPIFDNNIKVQHYTSTPAAKNPAPGLFQWKTFADGQFGEIDVPVGTYYGVHVDVEREVVCPTP